MQSLGHLSCLGYRTLTHACYGASCLALAITGILPPLLLETYRSAWAHERNRYARNGYTFLENKYYSTIYNDIVVETVKRPIAKWANNFNQNVLDRKANTAGETARDTGRWV